MHRNTALCALLLMLPLGCAAPAGEEGTEPSCTGAKCDGLPDGEDPGDDYYRQFLYRIDEASPAPFQYVSNARLWDLPGGDGDATMGLYLLGDGTFFFEVRETNKADARTEVVDGTWQVTEGDLVLAGLGRAEPIGYNGRDALQLVLSRDVLDAGLLDAPLTMSRVSSTGGLFHVLGSYNDGVCDSELGEFCAYGDDCGPCECGDGVCQRATNEENEDSCPADCLP